MESNMVSQDLPPSCSVAPAVGVIVSGCSGRMGRRLMTLVIADPRLKLLGGICASAARYPANKTRSNVLNEADGLRQRESLPADYLKASHLLPESGGVGNNVAQCTQVVHKQIEVEMEAPICASLEELLARPGLAQGIGTLRIVVDFSHPAGTMPLLQACARFHIPVVVGTTGFSAEQKRTFEDVAKDIPLCVAANFSLGMNLLLKLVGEAAAALGDQYDIELVEAHHSLKGDAPSGTALSLLESIASAKHRARVTDTPTSKNGYSLVMCSKQESSEGLMEGERPDVDTMTVVHGRVGVDAKRKKGEVGVHSLRLGNVVGEHSVIYASTYERVSLHHHAESRDVFAVGALQMVKWIALKPAGAYTISDMLWDNSSTNRSRSRP